MHKTRECYLCHLRTTHPTEVLGGGSAGPASPNLHYNVLKRPFFHGDRPTASLAVWAYVVSAEAMQLDVLLERDSWMRFNDRSYRTLPPRPGNNRVWGELMLSLSGSHVTTAFVLDSSAHHKNFHVLYAGVSGITFSRDHRLVEVDLVRSNGAPALAGCYLVDMLHAADNFSTEEHIVENGRQLIPLAGVVGLKPGALLGTSSSVCRPSCPTPQLLLHFLVTLAHSTSLSRAQLPLLPRTRISSCPHHSAWIPSYTICATKQFRHATNLFGQAYIPLPFPYCARRIERRPALEFLRNMEPLAATHLRNRV